jgi:hypothetical protein
MLFIFTIMELCDTFATYKLYFAFLSAGLLSRNYLFTMFKSNVTLLGRTAYSKSSDTSANRPKNYLKFLGTSNIRSLATSLSSTLKALKARLL